VPASLINWLPPGCFRQRTRSTRPKTTRLC